MSELQQAVAALQRAQAPHPDCKNTESDYPTDWDGIMPAALRVALAVHRETKEAALSDITIKYRRLEEVQERIRAAFGVEERREA